MPEHRQECTHIILKDINLIKYQLQQHQATHGKFTIEVAKQALLLTETHVQLAELLRTSRLETKQEESEYLYQQDLQEVTRLASLTFLQTRPTLSYNLRTVQVAAHLGLGGLWGFMYCHVCETGGTREVLPSRSLKRLRLRFA